MNKNENTPYNWKITRFLFLAIILFCINTRMVQSQPIIGAGEYIKIIKLIINDRIDVVSQIASGSNYKTTKNIDEYELDNILYKHDILFTSTSGTKYGDSDFYPFIGIECKVYPVLYEEININFSTYLFSSQLLSFQYNELKNFINNYFGVTLKESNYANISEFLATMDEISFPKFQNSNIEIGSCSIYQSKPILETFSVLSFNLKLYKKKQ